MSLVMDDIADIIEFYSERAAIFEFEAGFERKHAEVLALQEVKKHYGEQAKRRMQWENRKIQEGQS